MSFFANKIAVVRPAMLEQFHISSTVLIANLALKGILSDQHFAFCLED